MTSAFAKPLIVKADKDSIELDRVALSGTGAESAYSEDWLQDLLYRHPKTLPVAEIDDSFSGHVPLCREMDTPAGPVDVVYVTRSGRPVIVEAKLWRNPESRRKVIGQILDYAKELSRWNYETFDAAVRRARRKDDGETPKGLVELLGLAKDSPEAARFFDALSQSLKRGDLLLLIVGDGIREGVAAITEFLEGHASLHFTFGLVEMAIYRMPDGAQLVQPRVLAQSTIVRRVVVEFREGQATISDESAAELEAETDEVSEETLRSRERFQAFWKPFIANLKLDDRNQPIGAPAKTTNQYFMMPNGSNGWISAYVAPSVNRAGVYLTFSKGPIGDRLYAALSEDKEAIERALGIPIEWESDGKKHWIVTANNYSGRLLEDHAEEIRAKVADHVNRYVNVFRPRLEKLVRESA
jgi:hypothetical protein